MKRYLIKVLPYFFLVLTYIGVGEYMLYRSGELQPLESIVAEQISSGGESHFGGRLFPTPNYMYLYEHLKQRKAEIVVIGESITHQFQAKMFSPKEDVFFNASNIFYSMDDLEKVIGDLLSGVLHKPKLIILGLDPSYLKSSKEDRAYWKEKDTKPTKEINRHFHAIKMSYHQLKNRKYNKKWPIIEPDSYGLQGRRGMGRRQDGSGDNIQIIKEYNENPIYVERNRFKERLGQRTKPFESPLRLQDDLINRLSILLDQLKAANIEVVFYCQQFSSDFMESAHQDEDFMILWNQFLDLSKDLKNRGYAIIPPGTPSDIGLDDRYMRDANHSGEVMTAIQLLNLLEKKGAPVQALRDIDLEHLRQLIDKRKSEMEL